MATHRGNWAFRDLPEVSNGDTFEGPGCNLARAIPHTTVFAGVTGLTFRKCNLENCDVPGDAVIDDCLHYHKSRCKHVMADKGQTDNALYAALPDEPDDCPHVDGSDTITIDGQSVTTYQRSDKVVL